MLRHGHEQPAAWSQRPCDLGDSRCVIIEVFQYIECTNKVERIGVGQSTGIHLQEFAGRRYAPRCIGQARRVRFRTDEMRIRQYGTQAGQHEAAAAADFENIACLAEIMANEALNQTIPPLEPKGRVLHRIENVVRILRNAVIRYRQLRSETGKAGDELRLIAATRAEPIRACKFIVA